MGTGDVQVLGERVAGWAAEGVVVGDLDQDLEEVLDYVLDLLCGDWVRERSERGDGERDKP
jgi:hypothetical protein